MSPRREESEDAVLVLLLLKSTREEVLKRPNPVRGFCTGSCSRRGLNRCEDGEGELVVDSVYSGDFGCSMSRDGSVHAPLHHQRDPAGQRRVSLELEVRERRNAEGDGERKQPEFRR